MKATELVETRRSAPKMLLDRLDRVDNNEPTNTKLTLNIRTRVQKSAFPVCCLLHRRVSQQRLSPFKEAEYKILVNDNEFLTAHIVSKALTKDKIHETRSELPDLRNPHFGLGQS